MFPNPRFGFLVALKVAKTDNRIIRVGVVVISKPSGGYTEVESYFLKHDTKELITELTQRPIAYRGGRYEKPQEELCPHSQVPELGTTHSHDRLAPPDSQRTMESGICTSTNYATGRPGNRASHHPPGSSNWSYDPKQF